MSYEIDDTSISQTAVSASVSSKDDKVFGFWLRIDEGDAQAQDWMDPHEALQLRDWITKHFGQATTITTVEELDALPVGSVIRDSDPSVLEMSEKSSISGATWVLPGSDYEYSSGKVNLPAVLWLTP